MKKQKTILVLTSGGLAPALNATLYGIIKAARQKNYKILGGVNGWSSLAENGKIVDLTKLNIESIKNRGGTFLRSSRTNPFKVKNGINNLKAAINKHGIDCLIAIGGDDTLGSAAKLHQQEKISIIGLPKTIDNDLPNTYFSPGFPSAAYYLAKLAGETKEDSAYALNRIFIIETYGANAGWLVCSAALGGADVIIPPEWKFDLKNILGIINKKFKANNNYCVIAVSKEAQITGITSRVHHMKDGFGNKRKEFISLGLRKAIQQALNESSQIIIPINYLQSGQPIELDKKFGYNLGKKGVAMVLQGKYGQAAVVDFKNNKFSIKEISLKEFLKPAKKMAASMFNKKTMQPTRKYLNYLKTLLADHEFLDKDYHKLQKLILDKSSTISLVLDK